MNNISTKNIVFLLIIIGIISLGLKLYTIDFSVYPVEDTYGYVLRAIAHNNGDFSEHPRKTLGWSIAISPFYNFYNSDIFLDYVNIVRALSIGISLFTIYPMYLLARKFFDQKYSLCAVSFLAFEPHLNHNSGQGLSEPLYILLFIFSLYFILNKNTNYSYLSFLSVALLWWVRWSGVIMIIVVSVIFFWKNKKNRKSVGRYLLCLGIFLLVSSPMLIQRNEQFGDPLFFSQTLGLFTGDYATVLAENTTYYGPFDYIDEHGFSDFLHNFLIIGFLNMLNVIFKMSFPFLIVFLPFGILFSLRAFDQEKKSIRSVWLLILLTLASFILYFAIAPEKRLIFHIYPFLVILCVIPLQRVVKYGLSTFWFSEKQKNYFLIGVIAVVITLSATYTMRYELPDSLLADEKISFAKLINENLDGKILDAGYTLQGLKFLKLSEEPGIFKGYTTHVGIDELTKSNLHETVIYGNSLTDFLKNSKEHDLKYISVNQEGVLDIMFPFLNGVYEDEAKFPFLKKIYDTDNLDFKKLHAKVFEIDYSKIP